jgi:hypothetical protein
MHCLKAQKRHGTGRQLRMKRIIDAIISVDSGRISKLAIGLSLYIYARTTAKHPSSSNGIICEPSVTFDRSEGPVHGRQSLWPSSIVSFFPMFDIQY